MKRFLLPTTLLSAVLVASCSSSIKSEPHEVKNASRAQEATTDQVELGFWKNPNVIYVAENVRSGDERSFWDIPYLEKAIIDTAPADRNDGIVVGELGVDSGNKDMIVKLAQEIADGQYGDYDSLLIAQQDKLLFESYYKRGRINLTHWQASVTKPYVSLVVGRAIQLGYLTMPDLDKPLVSFLNELDPTKFVGGVEKITLHQAMTMRSGLRFSDEQIKEFGDNPSQFKGLDQIQAFLELSAPITSESQSYRYQSPDPIMVMQVIDAVVPGSAKDFIKNEFLGKIGINVYGWPTDLSGLPKADELSSITSRDMLKVGALVNNNGNWNGEQLISARYLANSTSKITKPTEVWQPDSFNYGYFWYQTDMAVGDKSYDAKIASGNGGQHIIALEELDLVIVVTGHGREDTIMTQVSKTILPAFVENSIPTKSGETERQNISSVPEGPYMGQNPPGLTPQVFAPGIVSSEFRDWTGSFTPDLKEYYFNRNNSKVRKSTAIVYKSENDQWQKTELGSRMGGAISPDGKTMHLGKQYRERTDDGWSELKSLGPDFEDIFIMTLKSSSKGTYVFDEGTQEGDGLLRYSRLVNGEREAPKPFGQQINTGKWTAHPFIAPDESYIIWDSENDGGYGGVDLYISFKQQDSSWGTAINFGDKINTDGPDSGGFVSPDGKYFFFNRKISPEDSDTYWVDAQIIENLRPRE